MTRARFVAVAANPDGIERRFAVSGQVGRTLKALVDAGPRGVTSLDIAETWALRTSHYIFLLRREHGLVIEMTREPHEGPAGPGWHGRYRLLTPVRLVEKTEPSREAAA
jgi:hypothetical protein